MQRQARVSEILSWRAGFMVARARITAAPAGADQFLPGEDVRVSVLTDLVGVVAVGEELRIDCSALAKSLGTGGYATTLAKQVLPPDTLPAIGHVMKARYTPHQHMVLALEEPDSPYRNRLEGVDDLLRMPVVVADLHSALTPILTVFKAVLPQARVAYIHDDSAALPVAFSQTVAQLRARDLLTATISAGQSFGGDYEAVSIPSALVAAHTVVNADLCIVAPGPGVMGTGTKWGFSGTASAFALHAAHSLRAVPIAAVRASSADPRPAHRGISHHSLSVLNGLMHCSVTVADLDLDPTFANRLGIDDEVVHRLSHQRARLSGHYLVPAPGPEVWQYLRDAPIPLSTMGRDLTADPLAFLMAGAGGWVASQVALESAGRNRGDNDATGTFAVQ